MLKIYEDKLKELRIEWQNKPEKRKIIELQARVIKRAAANDYSTPEDKREIEVMDSLW